MSLFFLAGEKSGDLLGARLVKELRSEHQIWGVGGQNMRAAGLEPLLYTEAFEAMGVTDTLLRLPQIVGQFKKVQHAILEKKPAACILIDYPGFNLRLASALRKKGYAGKIVQYVSPTVWAWGKDRIEKMNSSLDLLLSIFPFEQPLLKEKNFTFNYVGNPIFESVKTHNYEEGWHKLFGIRQPEKVIALFPGSRRSEVHLNLPLQLQAAELILQNIPDAEFALSCAQEEMMPLVHCLLSDCPLKLNKNLFLIPKRFSYELMRDAQGAIAKSGSVTLELALHETPTVVMYQISALNRFFAKYILKLSLKHYCIVNILHGQTVFPELIETKVTAEKLASNLLEMYFAGSLRTSCLEACRSIPDLLGDHNTSYKAAEAIRELLR